MNVLKRWKVLYVACAIGMIAYWIAFGFYISRTNLVQEETGRRLMAIAATAALTISATDLGSLRKASDMKTPEYQRVFKKLNDIRDSNENIQWIYILRPTGQENLGEFVADADSNYFLEIADDYNSDGLITVDEENIWPGYKYYYNWETFKEALLSPSYSKKSKWTNGGGIFLAQRL